MISREEQNEANRKAAEFIRRRPPPEPREHWPVRETPFRLTTGRYVMWCTCGFETQHYVYPRLAQKTLERHIEQAEPPVYGAGPGYN